ncbi:YciI family protein [Massilia sp. X63]|uniref:YciI family protein n=1 Tax=Massilia sp. X63 TaxID=3237285 RepID=UPI0034DD9780
MRFMILLKADQHSEAGEMPDEKLLTEMGRFNDELIKAGVMLAGEGLHPSSRGARVHFDKSGNVHVIDGPFAETKELLAGFWIWQLRSKEEAIAWVKRVPMPMKSGEAEIEIRQIFDMDDFGDAMTPELREQEARQRAALSG